jgi:hypothetical protein
MFPSKWCNRLCRQQWVDARHNQSLAKAFPVGCVPLMPGDLLLMTGSFQSQLEHSTSQWACIMEDYRHSMQDHADIKQRGVCLTTWGDAFEKTMRELAGAPPTMRSVLTWRRISNHHRGGGPRVHAPALGRCFCRRSPMAQFLAQAGLMSAVSGNATVVKIMVRVRRILIIQGSFSTLVCQPENVTHGAITVARELGWHWSKERAEESISQPLVARADVSGKGGQKR